MANVTYKIQWGDTLSEIAVKYNTTVSNLMALNPVIVNADLIYAGETIIVKGDPAKVAENNTYKATITAFGLQAGNSTKTLFATWTWNRSKTKSYQIRWKFKAGSNWHWGTNSNITVNENDPSSSRYSTYTIPNNAEEITFEVKPICDGSDWKASWSTKKTYYFVETPSGLTAELDEVDKTKLNMYINNINIDATKIEFQVVKNNTSLHTRSITSRIDNIVKYVAASCKVDLGAEYKVRCRAIRGNAKSDWSAFSSTVRTAPFAPASITSCRATSETSIYIAWKASKAAASYDIQYTTEKEDFELNSDGIKSKNIIGFTYCEINGLQSGDEYFFRVRAVNTGGESDWTDIVSVVIGDEPTAPTTWSSTTTVFTGDSLTLYWVHNATDGSSQTYAELEVYINDEKIMDRHIPNTTNEDEKDKTSFYTINTSEFEKGAILRWRVRTAGITKVYGDWSVDRYVDIYDRPSLEFSISNTTGGDLIDVLESFPLHVYGLIESDMQIPIGYHLTIVSNESYETIDSVGNTKMINEGEQIYSKYFDILTPLSLELSASDVDLENNIPYTISCLVSMDSGLTVESSLDFTVAWTDSSYWPNATIEIDEETFAAHISPYCADNKGKIIDDVLLSVYRREFNGSFTELAKDLENTGAIAIVDPHPSLDYARYRIVAITKSTGAVSYYDMPGHPVNGKSIIIQWNEDTTSFDITDDEALAEYPWSGSILKLPYNIDISNNHKSDVSFIEYIGREHPVSYYGTQLGETATWSVLIEKSDKETLYNLRRLAKWMGDVYVREPSGSGYWANITVSFSQKHCDVTIPVTLNITRVEGGA